LQTTAEITSNLDTEGQFAYDTDVKKVKFFNGTAIKTLANSDEISGETRIAVSDANYTIVSTANLLIAYV